MILLFMLPTITGMASMLHCTQLFPTEMGSCKLFLLRWAWNHDLPVSASQVAWDKRHIPLCPANGWDGVLWTFCLGWPQTLILLISASQVLQVWATRLRLRNLKRERCLERTAP
jgi:hypothetical protein